jgi:hypothetical protein
MNKVFLQIWEQSHPNNDITPDGASLHLEMEDRNLCLINFQNKKVLKNQAYTRTVGDYSEVTISDSIFEKLKIQRTIVLKENEFNNLIKFEDIK